MRRLAVVLSALVIIFSGTVRAEHDADEHSSNMTKVATYDEGGTYRQGTDLAFWGDTAVLGSFDNPGGFRLLDISTPAQPTLIGTFACAGNQADVAIWESLVVVSVDQPRTTSECGAPTANAAVVAQDQHWEGLRVVSIADPTAPVQIAAVKTACGSHTHTLVPDLENDRVIVYALSYPVSGQGAACNAATHQKFSIVEIPLADPAAAQVIATPSVSPAIGCHDVTVFLETMTAAAACLTESQIWDVSDPAAPKVVAHVPNPPGMNLAHSSAFSNDGETMVIGDELGGALATPGCLNEGHAPLGALWFYDASDPTKPELRGYYQLPKRELSAFCTAHNFNTIPLTSKRDILVAGFYNGGTTVIDYTNPANAKQIGFYIPQTGARAGSWSSYWYNGYIWSNNYDEDVYSSTVALPGQRSRGFDVFRLDEPSIANHLVTLDYLNPQTQQPIPHPEKPGKGKGRGPKKR